MGYREKWSPDGGAGLTVMVGGVAITYRWHAPTRALKRSFQAGKTALQATISWLEEHEVWRKALII